MITRQSSHCGDRPGSHGPTNGHPPRDDVRGYGLRAVPTPPCGGRASRHQRRINTAAACTEADIALLAVRDQAQAETALFGPDGVAQTLKAGSPVILTSTVGPDAARDLADKLAAAGYPLVDAPISGGPVRAGNGDLLIVVGADAATLDSARPVLDHLASTLTIVGPRPGDGQALKTINQLLAGVHIAAAAEAIALARGLDLDPALVIDACPKAPPARSCSPIAAPGCCRRTPAAPRSNPESTSSSKTWGS